MRIPIPIRSAALLRYLTFVGLLVIVISRAFAALPWPTALLPAERAPIATQMQALDDDHHAPTALFHGESEETSDDDSHDFDSLSLTAENGFLWLGPAFYPIAGTIRPNDWTIQPEAPPPRLC